MLANLLFSAFSGGDRLGFRRGWLRLLFGVVGVLLGAAIWALDFRQVEDGIKEGAPEKQSSLSAFGLTLTLVWIYHEILQLLRRLQNVHRVQRPRRNRLVHPGCERGLRAGPQGRDRSRSAPVSPRPGKHNPLARQTAAARTVRNRAIRVLYGRWSEGRPGEGEQPRFGQIAPHVVASQVGVPGISQEIKYLVHVPGLPQGNRPHRTRPARVIQRGRVGTIAGAVVRAAGRILGS